MPAVDSRGARRPRALPGPPALLAVLAAALALVALAVPVAGHSAPARHGAAAPTGIDVSNWQHEIDWLAAAGSGRTFVFAKATEGTTFTDVTFAVNRAGAAGVGMRIGAYHLARPAGASDAAVVASAMAQADRFATVVQPKPGELLPVLDLEATGNLSVARLTLWVQTWLSEVRERIGAPPIIYVSPAFWKSKMGDSPVFALAGNPLWIAHWTQAALPILPGASWGGAGWSVWQWSNCDHIPGITGCVDGDRLNGTSFARITMPANAPGVPVQAAAPTITGSAQAGATLAALPGSWSGGKPVTMTFQWNRCDAAGKGCSPVAGATGESYVPVAADVGHALTVAVSVASRAGSASGVSMPTAAVASSGGTPVTAPKPRTQPSLTGTTQVGQVLAVQAGTWTGSPTSFSYQWRRCAADGSACTPISGAAGPSYTLSPGEIGSTVRAVVTALAATGAGSATTKQTAVVVAAPLPAPAVGSTVAVAGQAGAVTTPGNVATATWQPGALPADAPVTFSDSAGHLPLPGTSVRLVLAAPAPLPWPVDVQYAAAPAGTVPGLIAVKGVWQPLAELASPTLPPGQLAGTYHDAAGALHVVVRSSARVGLFAAGKWGDPRYTTITRPRLSEATAFSVSVAPDGRRTLIGRITLDSQAHLYASVAGAGGAKLVVTQRGSRIGMWLTGLPTKTVQTLQLTPGTLPIRLRLPPRKPGARTGETLRIVAVDPYGRRSALNVKLAS
jgi:GH25 family lysozyme M1 (1,4-beta-N-acetylmuramidase)